MSQKAFGLIETIGFTAAVSAADAALKAADVTLEATERVIGVGGKLGFTIHLAGEVAAVSAAVEAGMAEADRVGELVSAHVIPRAHDEVSAKIITRFKGVGLPAGEPARAETVSVGEKPAKPARNRQTGKHSDGSEGGKPS